MKNSRKNPRKKRPDNGLAKLRKMRARSARKSAQKSRFSLKNQGFGGILSGTFLATFFTRFQALEGCAHGVAGASLKPPGTRREKTPACASS
jgi:hypothetical protein